jgi:tetratricopeptide (TPR) repeat protein
VNRRFHSVKSKDSFFMALTRLIILTAFSLLILSCKRTNEQLIQEAIRLVNKEKYKEAIDIYTKVINNNNKIELAYFNRGQCYSSIRQYDLAYKDFDTLLSRDPTESVVFTISPNSPIASEEDRTKVSLDAVFYERAIVKFYMDSVQSAYEDFQTLINLGYEKAFCTMWQGDLWHVSGDDKKACEFMQKARKLSTSDEEKKEAEKMIKEYCSQK